MVIVFKSEVVGEPRYFCVVCKRAIQGAIFEIWKAGVYRKLMISVLNDN